MDLTSLAGLATSWRCNIQTLKENGGTYRKIPETAKTWTEPPFFLILRLRRMELLGNLIVLASALVCLAASGSGAWSEARSAIAVTQALSVCGLLNWTVRTIACQSCTGCVNLRETAETLSPF